MKVLLTGYNGYIGSIMADIFTEAGHEVTGLDTHFFKGCDLFEHDFGGKILSLDLRDISPATCEGFDAVVHMGALSNDPLGDLNPQLTYDINYEATVSLAKAAREAGVSRFVYASSCSIYGASGVEGLVTEEAPFAPITPYAESKVLSEAALKELATDSFSPTYMRNSTAYGVSPRLRVDIVLNNLVAWAVTTGKVKIMSDGTAWRPIAHIRDLSSAVLHVLAADRSLIHNEAFNIGANTENYQVKDLANIVCDVVPGCTVEFGNQNNTDPRSYRVDFSKLHTTFPAFSTAWNARRGAEELYKEYTAAGMTLESFQGRKYIRLNQLKDLLNTHSINDQLRWEQPV